MRHITGGVLSMQHITWTAYERATHHGWRTECATHHGWHTERAAHHGVDIQKRASGQERRKRDSSLRNVVGGPVN